MKKVSILIAIASAFILPGCKKSSSSPSTNYSIVLTVDGVKQTMKPMLNAQIEPLGAGQSLFLSGTIGDAPSNNIVTIAVFSFSGDLHTGTYDKHASQVSYGTNYDGPNYTNSSFEDETASKVVITSITATDVQGTFTATVKNHDNALKQITDGSFHISILP